VTLEDVALPPLGKAVSRAATLYERRHLSGIEARDALDRLIPDPEGLGRARADLVIEAAPERPDLKEKIYAGLVDVLKPGAILEHLQPAPDGSGRCRPRSCALRRAAFLQPRLAHAADRGGGA